MKDDTVSLVNQRWVQGWNINASGTLFGGALMSWCDEDATLLVRNNCRNEITTVGADRIRFISPAEIGDRLKFEHRIVHVGRCSMTVLSKVYVINDDSSVLCYEVYTTLCAIDDNFKPTAWSLKPGLMSIYKDLEQEDEWKRVEEMRKLRRT